MYRGEVRGKVLSKNSIQLPKCAWRAIVHHLHATNPGGGTQPPRYLPYLNLLGMHILHATNPYTTIPIPACGIPGHRYFRSLRKVGPSLGTKSQVQPAAGCQLELQFVDVSAQMIRAGPGSSIFAHCMLSAPGSQFRVSTHVPNRACSPRSKIPFDICVSPRPSSLVRFLPSHDNLEKTPRPCHPLMYCHV